MITPNFDSLNHMRIPSKEVSITWNDLPSEIVADSLCFCFEMLSLSSFILLKGIFKHCN